MSKRMWLPATIDQPTHQRLENWGDEFQVRRVGRLALVVDPSNGRRVRIERRSLTNGGIETQYRAPGDAVMKPSDPWEAQVDGEDALLVNRVIMHPGFPEWHRRFLALHYRDRVKPEKLHRTMGIRWRDYLRYQAASVLVVRNRLTVLEARLYAPIHNLPSARSRGVSLPGSSEGEARQAKAAEALAA